MKANPNPAGTPDHAGTTKRADKERADKERADKERADKQPRARSRRAKSDVPGKEGASVLAGRRRTFGLAAAALIAVAGIAILVVGSGKSSAADQSKTREVEVLVALAHLPNGTDPASGTARAAMALRKLPVDTVAPDALRSVDELDTLTGLKLSTALDPGDQVLRSSFGKTVNYAADTAPVEVPAGLLQQSFTLENQRVLGGRLRPGDRVGVMVSYPNAAVTHLALSKVLVANVQAEQLPSDPQAANAASQDSLAQTFGGNLTVTLALDAPSAEKLTHALEFGKIWLAVESADAPEAGIGIQTMESVLGAPIPAEAVKP
jgi:pilus assembly protein CpaB